ncbi:hypothetical protein FSARC_7593 [Fusarium sarcochroum]|uniref:1-alkyl-2-acetylglycerophosphocholine esterase n=1 Tax=Fusarium sarcochroum TaxID=1208366 RepID=A0A8H4TUP2_9HYPO|nr:hypothetical protein FSARC_7593 [Fusarium sarcochroum]
MRFALFFLSLLELGNAVLLPKPSGPYGVALKVHAMTDNHRIDPYDPKHGQRQVLASIFWPVDADSCSKKKAPYMPPATAEIYGKQAEQMGLSKDTFKAFEMEVCSVSTSSKCKSQGNEKKQKFPLAIFSPGAGNSRLLYSAMARSLASYGNVVVLIDHPYDAVIVEFPDGTIIPGGNIPEDTATLENLTQVRAKDISFVISQIQRPSFQRKVLKSLPGAIDDKKIVTLGHSLGGASAAAAIPSDPRIRGGMNLDGRLFDPVLSKGLDKPFMLLGRPNHHSEDTTWVEFWKSLKGAKIELGVSGTVHGSFTDFPLLINALGLPEAAKKQAAPQFGSVDGIVLQKIISETLAGFMSYSFGGSSASMQKTIKGSKELSVVKSQLPAH